MEDRTKRAVSLVLEDGIEGHCHELREELADHDRKVALQRRENDSRAKEKGYLSAGAIESGIPYWVNLASIFRTHAEKCVNQLGPAVREVTLDHQAGEMLRVEVNRFLDELDKLYEKRLDNRKPFLRVPSGYKDFWLRERIGLARKIEIECLKFVHDASGGQTSDPAASTEPLGQAEIASPCNVSGHKSDTTQQEVASQGGETQAEPRRRRKRRAKYRDDLFVIFKQHPILALKLPEKDLLRHVQSEWKGKDPPTSPRTVARYRAEWEKELQAKVEKANARSAH